MSEPMDLIYKDPKYPSSKVVNGLSMAGPRAHLRGMGLVNEELAKPFIGVINTYNEMHRFTHANLPPSSLFFDTRMG